MKIYVKKGKTIFCVLICLAGILFFAPNIHAKTHGVMTPNDVYSKVMGLKARVTLLRTLQNIEEVWPVIPLQTGKQPRHVLQKTLEVLDKINRLRIIKGLGEITIPTYPSRKITPNEILDMVERLINETDLVIRTGFNTPELNFTETTYSGKSPNDVYRELWAISNAMDPVLGIRGFHAGDVDAKSLLVLQEVRFLRSSQGLPEETAMPEMTKGKHPNHALKAAYSLLKKIVRAEQNLWIDPITVPSFPRRVIEPPEAYDTLQIITAELQRIKYRIGIEYHYPTPAVEDNKTCDTIIQNLVLAEQLMPDFDPETGLVQYDKKSLLKTPSHVYAVTEHIMNELERYRSFKGIHNKPRKTVSMSGLRPMHVYQKTVEVLEKINWLRSQTGLGPIAVPNYPFREITPVEVFDLATRLDSELEIIYKNDGMDVDPWYADEFTFTGKTPSHVYDNMWRISYLLDTLQNHKGYRPTDVYKMAAHIILEIKDISDHLGIKLKKTEPEFRPGLKPKDVIKKIHEILNLLKKVQQRAGISILHIPVLPIIGEITPNDVFNQTQVLRAEISALKIHLRINTRAELVIGDIGEKTPSHVYQKMESIQAMLQGLLTGKVVKE